MFGVESRGMSRVNPPEIALCAAWHAGDVSPRLATVEGETLEIVHRGAWTHGLGPDFRDALILFSGRELRAGGVEIHLRTRGWVEHGHHLDPAYNAVILHLVLRHDGAETRRQDGALVPVAVLDMRDGTALPDLAGWDWDRVGGASCAEDLTRRQPQLIRELLFRLGDRRLAARSARLEARLSALPPAEVLWQELLDGLGFSANREPMRSLATLVPLADLEAMLRDVAAGERLAAARGVLLGAAGFLPLSPTDAHLGRLAPGDVAAVESAWSLHGAPWRPGQLLPGAWDRTRVRPANHPVPRLLAAANLVAAGFGGGGLLAVMLATLVDDADPVVSLRSLTAAGATAGIGADRALDILASGVIPFALAFAASTGDDDLATAAAGRWESLPSPAPNAVTRRGLRQVVGRARLGNFGVRGAQGLIQLDTTLCQPRRCFECPVAAAVLSAQSPEPADFGSSA
jgi:hypothetical protein